MCWSEPMSRFTGEQRSYFEGMKILIDLYYTHRDENSGSSGKSANKYHENKDFCFSNDIVEKYIRLFCTMIPRFSPFLCINRKRTITFIFRGQDYLMVFNPKMWLVRYFDGLYQEILENRFIHWRIYESSQETCTYHMESGSGAILQGSSKDGSPSYLFFDAEHENSGSVPERFKLIKKAKTDRIEAKTGQYFNEKELKGIADRLFRKGTAPFRQETYAVSPLSAFGASVTTATSNKVPGPIKIHGNTFLKKRGIYYSPGHSDALAFPDFIQGMLIGFQSVFGSFERVKLCKYRECRRLFIEKRSGKRDFCNPTCKKRYNDSLQSPSKRLCRIRQNAWLLNQGHEIRMYQLECEESDICPAENTKLKGGSCPEIEKKLL